MILGGASPERVSAEQVAMKFGLFASAACQGSASPTG